MKTAFLLAGPTAVGKTSVAHALALEMGLPVLSTDSMLVYRGMNIGTAKPTDAELCEVNYFGLNLVSPEESFHTAAWLAALRSLPDHCLAAGGTGLYLKTLLCGLDAPAPHDPELRLELETLPLDALQARLRGLAPERLKNLADPKNPRRVIRAIEQAVSGADTPTSWRKRPPPPLPGLRMDKEALHQRISRRVDQMFDEGLVEECENLLTRFPLWSDSARQAIGYAEAAQVVAGSLTTDEAKAAICQRTRRLAKQQMTFFNGQFDMQWITIEPEEPLAKICQKVKQHWKKFGHQVLVGIPEGEPDAALLQDAKFSTKDLEVKEGNRKRSQSRKVKELKSAARNVQAMPKKSRVTYRVADLPQRMQPRELFDQLGPEHVTEDVLLAIVLRSGAQGKNVIDLARDLLQTYGSLTHLAQAGDDELLKPNRFPGLGPVKLQCLRAALELARRMSREQTSEQEIIDCPDAAARLMRETVRTLDAEHFWILMLDPRNQLKRAPFEVTKGLVNASLVHPREVFKEAIRQSCAAVVLVHNHPSGDPTPSPEDIRVTRQLVKSGKILDIEVIDHVIVGRKTEGNLEWWVSLRESGLVNFD